MSLVAASKVTWPATLLRSVIYGLVAFVGGYAAFLGLLTIPLFQDQAIYLNAITMTWFQDLNVPEEWGFLRNQVTPFTLSTTDGETLHAWHILPINLYKRHEEELVAEPHGLVSDITTRLGFQLLRDDPESRLVLYLHGAAGTLGSGYRPPSYRAMYATAPDKIHTVAIDYRGFGSSTGKPSEEGLLTDALTLAEWAMKTAGIPPERIAIFSQSLGTAVGISLAHHLAMKPEPVLFSGMVLVAPFVDVELLTATYRLAGTIPVLDPVARFPAVLAFLNTFIRSKWPSKEKLAQFIQRVDAVTEQGGQRLGYDITIIHAQDDYDIPWTHSEALYWHAINATMSKGISYKELEVEKRETRRNLGGGGWTVDKLTRAGHIREQITKWGLHDRIMSYPIVSSAVNRALRLS